MRKSEGGSSPVPKRSRFNGRINRRLLPFSSRVLRSLSPVGGLTRRQPPPPVQTVDEAALAEWYGGSDKNHVRNFGEPVAGAARYGSDMQTQRFRSVSPPTARHPPLRPRHHTPEPLGRHPKPNNGGLVHVDSDEYGDDDGYDGSEEEFEEDVPVDEEDLDSEPEVESDDDADDANW